MGSLLVHVTHGPEAPTRAALAVLVAKSAVDAGHEVALFFAGDATNLLRDATAETVQGIGTGNFGEDPRALGAAGVPIYASGMSAKARGVQPAEIGNVTVEFAMPSKLVELTMASDRVLTY
jgi:predicted peroxiredoxin